MLIGEIKLNKEKINLNTLKEKSGKLTDESDI
jgi:hypothetical protein